MCPFISLFGQRKLKKFNSLQIQYEILESSLKNDIYFQHSQTYQYTRRKMQFDISAFEQHSWLIRLPVSLAGLNIVPQDQIFYHIVYKLQPRVSGLSSPSVLCSVLHLYKNKKCLKEQRKQQSQFYPDGVYAV